MRLRSIGKITLRRKNSDTQLNKGDIMPVQRGRQHLIDKDAKLVDLELIKPVQVCISEKRLDQVRK